MRSQAQNPAGEIVLSGERSAYHHEVRLSGQTVHLKGNEFSALIALLIAWGESGKGSSRSAP
jgi:hypothetical protein